MMETAFAPAANSTPESVVRDYTKIKPILRSVAVIAISGPSNSGAIDSLIGTFVAARGVQSPSENAGALANPKKIFVERGTNPDRIVEEAVKTIKELGPNIIPIIAMSPLDGICGNTGLPLLGPSILTRIRQQLESDKIHGVIAIGIVSRENPTLEDTVFCKRNGNDRTVDAFDKLLEIAGAATSIHLSVYDDTPISEIIGELAHRLEYRLFVNPPEILSSLTIPRGFGLTTLRKPEEELPSEESDEAMLARLIAANSLKFANSDGSGSALEPTVVVNIPSLPLMLHAEEVVGTDRTEYNPPNGLRPDDFPNIKGKRVLIIDDQPATTVFQTAALDWASEGNISVFQHEGQSAEDVAKIMLNYDLIIIDRSMGFGVDNVRIKGEDCVRKYNELTANSGMPRAQIFSFTGETAEPEIIAGFAEVGVQAYAKETDTINPIRFLTQVDESLAAY